MLQSHTLNRPQIRYPSSSTSFSSTSSSSTNTMIESDSVHIMFHLGNTICLENLLLQDIPNLIGEVLCGVTNEQNEIWRNLLKEIEEKIRNLYRHALTSTDRLTILFY